MEKTDRIAALGSVIRARTLGGIVVLVQKKHETAIGRRICRIYGYHPITGRKLGVYSAMNLRFEEVK